MCNRIHLLNLKSRVEFRKQIRLSTKYTKHLLNENQQRMLTKMIELKCLP